jgi:mannose-6-phosphate isomerase
MTIERARTKMHLKPWGVTDLRPWSDAGEGSARIGELSYERSDRTASAPALLLKLLFASEPLSIQVHPDDEYARSIGLPNGKSEAWYVLAASAGAKVAIGLNRSLTQVQLRQAIDDGSIAGLVDWRVVKMRDVLMVPAGTIHAIGAGVVIAEIQQRSDATFRLFDHGRARALHVDDAVAVSVRTSARDQPAAERISAERTLLAANAHFVLEHIVLAPDSAWCLDATRETWMFVLNGIANAGSYDLVRGDTIFAQSERVDLEAGRIGVECLVAYTGAGGAAPLLLQRIAQQSTRDMHTVRNDPALGMRIGAGL